MKGSEKMCLAKDYSDQLLNIYNSIEDSFKELSDKLSYIDIEQQKVLHELESNNFNAYKGYLLAKQLKEIRIERRKIKNELAPLINLRNNFLQKNDELLKKIHNNIINQEERAINFKPYNPEPKNESNKQNNMRLKKSGKKIISWMSLEDGSYCVKLTNGVKHIVKESSILDLDDSKKVVNI